MLARCLGLSEAEAVAWAGAKGWAVEGSVLELPAAADNSPRPGKKLGEEGLGLKYGDVSAVLGGQRGY